MNYKFNYIVQSLPKKKNSKSSFWVKLIVRRLSFLFTYIFINLGFSAWGASIFSVIVALIGSILLSINNNISMIWGVVCIQLWLIMDCVDGNIARCKNSSSDMGEFVDALSGYFISAFVYLAIGIAAYNTSTIVPEKYLVFLIISGAIASIANILARLIHQKYIFTIMILEKKHGEKYTLPEEQVENKRGLQYLRSRIDKELGLSGLFMPFLIVSAIFNCFDIMIAFYTVFSVGSLVIVTLYYGIKSKI